MHPPTEALLLETVSIRHFLEETILENLFSNLDILSDSRAHTCDPQVSGTEGERDRREGQRGRQRESAHERLGRKLGHRATARDGE